MKIITPPRFELPHPVQITEGQVEAYEKKIIDLKKSFLHPIPDALADKIAYKVVSFPTQQPALAGTLKFGITYLNPFKVEGEYSFTRGHFHSDRNYDEYYFGISGNGFLLFWDGEDDVYAEKVFPGSIHYINGKYAHRLINTDQKEVMAVGCCWNVVAGHDYDTIDRLGFPVRCFEENGEPVWK